MKAIDALHPLHRAYVISTLKAIGLPLGLVLHFKVAVLKKRTERTIQSR